MGKIGFATETEKEEAVETDTTDSDGDSSSWSVVIHNDAVTPMDFVVAILVRVFERSLIIAEAIMWEAHQRGFAYVATLPKAVAQSKISQAHFAAQLEGYPLKFTLESDKK